MSRVVTPPATTALTTLAHVKGELRLLTPDAERDAWLQELIQDASDAILDEVDRPLMRQRVAERFEGGSRTTVLLDLTPIVALEAVVHDDLGAVEVAQDRLAVSDAKAGIVWRLNGWEGDQPATAWLTQDYLPQQGRQSWEATYVGGYLSRADDMAAIGVLASGRDLLLPTGSVAPLLASGESVLLRGWCHAGNNRRALVQARTETVITVDFDLETETGGDAAMLQVRTLPATLERCCLDAVRSWYYSRDSDPNVVQEKIGDWAATYKGGRVQGGSGGDVDNALPANVLRTLDRYRRVS